MAIYCGSGTREGAWANRPFAKTRAISNARHFIIFVSTRCTALSGCSFLMDQFAFCINQMILVGPLGFPVPPKTAGTVAFCLVTVHGRKQQSPVVVVLPELETILHP